MPSHESHGGKTVLVVDDAPDIRELLGIMLRMKGCRVAEAENGQVAVELAPRVNPDLILMDLTMPVLDGFEATRRLREQRETRRVPVVAVSAFSDARNREKALEAGCVEFVGKPVDFTALDSLLGRLLH